MNGFSIPRKDDEPKIVDLVRLVFRSTSKSRRFRSVEQESSGRGVLGEEKVTVPRL